MRASGSRASIGETSPLRSLTFEKTKQKRTLAPNVCLRQSAGKPFLLGVKCCRESAYSSGELDRVEWLQLGCYYPICCLLVLFGISSFTGLSFSAVNRSVCCFGALVIVVRRCSKVIARAVHESGCETRYGADFLGCTGHLRRRNLRRNYSVLWRFDRSQLQYRGSPRQLECGCSPSGRDVRRAAGAIVAHIAYPTLVRTIGIKRAILPATLGTLLGGFAGCLVYCTNLAVLTGVIGFFVALVWARIRIPRSDLSG